MRKQVIPCAERDELIERRTQEFAQNLGKEITRKFPLPEGEKLIFTPPRVVLERVKWVIADYDEAWEDMVSLPQLPEEARIVLNYVYQCKDKAKSWWLDPRSVHDLKPPLGFSKQEIFYDVTQRGRIDRMLSKLSPRFMISFEETKGLRPIIKKGLK